MLFKIAEGDPARHLMAQGPQLPTTARRAEVETTSATLKNRMGLMSIRDFGLAKATAQVTTAALDLRLRRRTWLATP
jgi:IS5 family transposase